METIGYVYYSDGRREEVAHTMHGDAAALSALRSVEQSTAQAFAYRLRNTPSWTNSEPMRYDVQQH